MTTLSRPLPRAVGLLGDALRWRPLIAFALTVIALFALVGALTTANSALYGASALPGVTVGGVPIGGLDRAAAESTLRAVLPPLDRGTLTVEVDGNAHGFAYADVGRDYAIPAMLDEAFAIGRSGDILDMAGKQLRAATGGIDVALQATWDEDLLIDSLARVVSAVSSQPVNAAVERDASNGYSVVPARAGRVIDLATLRARAVAALAQPDPADAVISVTATQIAPAVATSSAEGAVSRFDAATSIALVAAGGGVTQVVDVATLRTWVSLLPAADGSGWNVDVDRTAVAAWMAPYAVQIDRPPQDATFELTADGVVALPGVTGQTLNVAESVGQVAQLIETRAAGGDSGTSVELAVTTTEPSFTTAQATALAGQVEMVSSWTTRFIPGPSNFFGENIRVPAKILNGTVVQPAERFSFLDGVGEISPATGFGPGGAIIRGHTKETGAMGGGICSASTTLFNAALRYGYDIVDRTQHSYYISRYPVGLDATVFRSGSQVVDMAFVNDSQYPLWIRGLAGKRKVTFQIWTVPDGRTVEINEPTITNKRPAEDVERVNEDMKPGTSKRVEYPVDGFTASVAWLVRDASGATLHEKTFYSRYITVTGITEVGPTPEPPPTEPPPTEPPPTEPPPTEPPPTEPSPSP